MTISTHLLPHVSYNFSCVFFLFSLFLLSLLFHHCRAPVSTTRKLGLDLDAPRQGLDLLKGQGLGLFQGVADTVTGLFAKVKKQAVTPLIHAKITTATTSTSSSSSSSSVQTPVTATSGGEGVVSADEGDDAGQKDVDAKMALTIGRDGTVTTSSSTTNTNTPHLRGGATAAAAAAVAVVAAAVAPLPTAATEPKTTTTSTTTTTTTTI